MRRFDVWLAEGHASKEQLAALEHETGELRTLEQVVRWALTQSPPRRIDTVVNQDEYTLDVVVPFEDLCIVFDTT
jgi:hypothetical protein